MGAVRVASPPANVPRTAPGPFHRPVRPWWDRLPLWPVGPILRATAVLVVLVAVCSFAGVELATPGGTGYAHDVDTQVDAWLAAHDGASVIGLAGVLDVVGGTVGTLALAVAAGTSLARRTDRRTLALAPLVAVSVAVVVTRVIELVVARPTPGIDPAKGSVTGTSFPSLHAALTTAAVATIWLVASRQPGRLISRRSVAALAAFGVVVAGSALVAGAQWFSDVVAGIVVGGVVALLVSGWFSHRRRRSRPGWLARFPHLVAIGVVIATIPIATSYLEALTYPGQAAASVRTVDWLRTSGFGGEVDRAEAWWLWHHVPSATATLSALPPLPGGALAGRLGRSQLANGASRSDGPTPPAQRSAVTDPPPAAVPAIVSPALPGEGQWTAVETRPDGRIQIAATRLRPDPTHPELVTTLAWMDPATVRFTLVAGTREPGGGPGPWGAQVPSAEQPSLLAAFNSGFKMRDTPGGAIEEGRKFRSLTAGLATLAVRPDGTATVGVWGRDLQPGPEVIAARQNLLLIVDGGQVVAGLQENAGGRWGPLSQAAPAWRSGLGVDAFGHLIYASGNHLTLPILAEVLQRAGAVRAMELDIHSHMVTFNLFTHPAGISLAVGHKLSPDMIMGADRYLTADQRDFVAVFAR